jgi:membrane protein
MVRARRVIGGTLSVMFSMETALRAAGVAFFGFLSIFPVIASAVLVLGLVADANALLPLIDWLRPFAPESAMSVLDDRLNALLTQSRSDLGIGLLVSATIGLWSSTRGINALIHAICDTQDEPVARSIPAAIGLSLVMTFGGLVLVSIALASIAAIPAVVGYFPVPRPLADLAMALRWPFLWLVIIVSLGFMYFASPGRGRKRRHPLWPGALLASVLWIAVSLALSFYVENIGSFEATFGSLAAAVVLLFWLYYSALIVIAGAAFNAQFERRRPEGSGEDIGNLGRALEEVTNRADE